MRTRRVMGASAAKPAGRCGWSPPRYGTTSRWRMSPVRMVTFGGTCVVSAAARSRSISTARIGAPVRASGSVSAPRPGPTSRKTSPGAGLMPARTFSAHLDARKCCPKRRRLRGGLFRVACRRLIDIAVPVALLDFLDFFLRQAEVVADLVNEGLADRDDQVVLVRARVLNRPLEERDLVGEAVAIGPLALGDWRALVESQQRIGRLDPDLAQLLRVRFVLDDDGDVLHRVAESGGDGGEGLIDQ